MATKRAKVLEPDDVRLVLDHIGSTSRMAVRDRLLFLLSVKAGLRSGEIAQLPMSAMTTPSGTIAPIITVFNGLSKSRNSREIPMHPDIKEALKAFRYQYPTVDYVAFSTFRHGGRFRRMKPGALTTWFWRLYDNVGLNGCSSHSGRRTFGTEMARRCNHFHASLYDVQKMLGHARLETTQAYIAPSQDTYNMVASLGYADFRPEAVQSADDVRPQRRNTSSAPRAAKAKSYRANAWRYRT